MADIDAQFPELVAILQQNNIPSITALVDYLEAGTVYLTRAEQTYAPTPDVTLVSEEPAPVETDGDPYEEFPNDILEAVNQAANAALEAASLAAASTAALDFGLQEDAPLDDADLQAKISTVSLIAKYDFALDSITQEDLAKLAWDGTDLERFKGMLNTLPVSAINSPNSRKQTALYCACRNGHVAFVDALLKVPGIDAHQGEVTRGSTPLHAAGYNKHGEITGMLLAFGADPNRKNTDANPVSARFEAREEAIHAFSTFEKLGLEGIVAKYPSVLRIRSDDGCWGKMTLTVSEAKNLKGLDIGGTSDPFVVIEFQSQRFTTVHQPATLNPKWDDKIYLNVTQDFPVKSMISLWDHNDYAKHAYMAQVPFAITNNTAPGMYNLALLGKKNEVPKKSLGNLMIKTSFVSYVDIVQAVRGPHMFLLKALTKTKITDPIAASIMYYSFLYNMHFDLVKWVIDSEVDQTIRPEQLFRLDSNATKLLVAFLKRIGADWYAGMVGDLIKEVCTDKIPFEVDTNKLQDQSVLAQNQKNLLDYTTKFLEAFLGGIAKAPIVVLKMAREVQKAVHTKFPEASLKAVGGIMFLRWFCPLIITPTPNIIANESITPVGRRSLLLIAKIIQNVANKISFGDKEQYMVFSNTVVQQYLDPTTKFLETLSQDKEYYEAPVAHDIEGHVKTLDELIVYMHANYAAILKLVNDLGKPGNLDMDKLKAGLDAMLPLISLQAEQTKRANLQTPPLIDQLKLIEETSCDVLAPNPPSKTVNLIPEGQMPAGEKKDKDKKAKKGFFKRK